jgi:hypothetical protein
VTDARLAALIVAWEAGDPGAMGALLDADVVLLCDTGGVVDGPSGALNGAEAVSRWMLARFSPGSHRLLPARANTRPAVCVERDGDLVGTVVLRLDGDRVTMLWLTLNPEKLRASPPGGSGR